jgi:putative intracellular protease/amidase
MRKYRDRIKAIRTVKASELVDNPDNWRIHPPEQTAELRRVMTEIGNCDVLKVVEMPDGRLLLVDGHDRKGLHGDSEVRVAVLDLDENEAAEFLRTYDAIGAMAKTNQAALAELKAKIDNAPPVKPLEQDIQSIADAITTEEPVTETDERQAEDTAHRISNHFQRLAKTAPDKLQAAQVVVVPTGGPCALLVIADPDLEDIVRELRQRHEDGETHILDRLFDCIWTPGNA